MEYLSLVAQAGVTSHSISIYSRSELRFRRPEELPCTEDPHANGSPHCTASIHQLSATAYNDVGSHLISVDFG